jgi:galactokinase
MQANKLTVSSWGRICLFGEHQDYLELPVIAAAINLSITITGTPRTDHHIILDLPDVGERREFKLGHELPYFYERDYLPSALNNLLREGIVPPHGWDCIVRGTIPINAGSSSSSALVVAFVKFLLAAAGVVKSPEEIAILANRAEVLEFGEPGGLMDHYLSTLGGVYHLDFCRKPAIKQALHTPLSGFVLGNSLEPKPTTGMLRQARESAEEAFHWAREHTPELHLRTSPREDFAYALRAMPAELCQKLEANLINRDLCEAARQMLSNGRVDQQKLGQMLLEHHYQLSVNIGVSTPKLDRMVKAAMDAGALGAKLNGSGGGGCMFAYAPGREREVAEALEQAGGKAYILTIPERLPV